MKKILISLMHFMIVFTIVHAPIVLQYPVTNYGVVYAGEEGAESEPTTDDIPDSGEVTGVDLHSECGDSNTRGEHGEYLYRPGCAFKNEASLVDQLNPEWWDLLLNTLLALVFVSMLFYLRAPRDILDCPGNVASKISWWTAKIGSLVYIIAEFSTNAAFRSIAKSAIDKSFMPTEDQVETNKQLEAFNSLLDIYNQQKIVAGTKLGFSIALEAAYLTAEGAELANIFACTSECSLTFDPLEAEIAAALKALTATIKAYDTAGYKPLAAAQIGSPTSPAVCSDFLTSMEIFSLDYDFIHYELLTLAIEEVTTDTAKATEKTTTVNAAVASTLTMVPVSIFSEAITKASLISDTAEAGANGARAASKTAILNGMFAKVETAAGLCSAAIAADIATCSAGTLGVGAGVCSGVLGTAETQTAAVLPAIAEHHALLQGLFNMPILCCGTEGDASGPTRMYTAPPPGPGTSTAEKDRVTSPIPGTTDLGNRKNVIKRIVEYKQNTDANNLVFLFNSNYSYEEVFSLFESEFNKTELDYIYADLMKQPIAREVIGKIEQGDFTEIFEKIMYNLYFKQIMKDIRERNIKDPVYEKALIAYHLNQLDQKMHKKRLLELNKPEIAYLKNRLQNILGPLISNAYAEDQGFGPLGEWLFVGGGALVWTLLELFLSSSSLIKVALESPTGRSIMWGVLIVLIGIVIGKNGNTIADVNSKIEALEKEMEKFIDTNKPSDSGISSQGTEYDRSGTSYENVDYSRQALQAQSNTRCASVGSDGSFMPASCPSKVAPGSFNVTNGLNRIKGNLDPSHLQGLSSLAATAQDVASTGTMNPSNLTGANLEAVKQNNAAIRKANEKLRKNLDKKFEKFNKKSKSKLPLMSSLNKKAQALFTNRGKINGAVKPSNINSLAKAISKEFSKDTSKDLIKEGKGEGQMRAGFAPKLDVKTPEFDFNMDDPNVDINDEMNLGLQDEKGKEKNLKNFVIKHNDINKNKGASIFKILSNRYILSYPKIIPEKKKAKLDLPKSKNEQGQSQAPSKTLEDQLKNLKKK